MTIVDGLDALAYKSPALKWPPMGKLLLCVSLLIGSLSSRTIYGPLIVLGVGLSLFYYSIRGRMPPLFILYLIAGALIFDLSGALIIAATQPGTPLYGVAIAGIVVSATQNGINLAILVFLRSLAGLFVVLFFASSTPVPHIFNALVRAGLPDYIAETAVLVYRYSFMILEQSVQMTNAAACRLGFSGWGTVTRTTGVMAANLFIRSLEFAERSQCALQSRNYGGRFHVFRMPAPLNIAWVGLAAAALAVVYLAGNFP